MLFALLLCSLKHVVPALYAHNALQVPAGMFVFNKQRHHRMSAICSEYECLPDNPKNHLYCARLTYSTQTIRASESSQAGTDRGDCHDEAPQSARN